MSTINRTFCKELNACALPRFTLLYFLLIGFLPLSSAQQIQLTFEDTEGNIAYVSPFKHTPDGMIEVAYEEGIELKLEENMNLVLPDIFFELGATSLLPESEYVLQDLVRILNENPDIAIELSAHTDSRGNTRSNERLSKNRARNMVKYLTQNGVNAARLISVGYGEDKLRNHCGNGIVCTDAEHRENRRIEMRTVKLIGQLPTRSTYIYKN